MSINTQWEELRDELRKIGDVRDVGIERTEDEFKALVASIRGHFGAAEPASVVEVAAETVSEVAASAAEPASTETAQ